VAAEILYAFDAGTVAAGWQIVNDGVMGGASSSDLQPLAPRGVVFSGNLAADNGGGFASVRSPPLERALAGHTAFAIHVRGDGQRYRFTARSGSAPGAPLYQCPFETTRGAWQHHTLAFGRFVPTFRGRVLEGIGPLLPGKGMVVGFLIADRQYGGFRLEVESVAACAGAA
jgi:NADH dehydrogenase [ubiquinone] 1 alpha subcomplex assembly factor 1